MFWQNHDPSETSQLVLIPYDFYFSIVSLLVVFSLPAGTNCGDRYLGWGENGAAIYYTRQGSRIVY